MCADRADRINRDYLGFPLRYDWGTEVSKLDADIRNPNGAAQIKVEVGVPMRRTWGRAVGERQCRGIYNVDLSLTEDVRIVRRKALDQGSGRRAGGA